MVVDNRCPVKRTQIEKWYHGFNKVKYCRECNQEESMHE